MQILTVAIRVIQQVLKDKRTLLFLLFAPVLVLSLLYLIIGSATGPPTIGVVDVEASLEDALAKEATIQHYASLEDAETVLRDRNIDAYFPLDD